MTEVKYLRERCKNLYRSLAGHMVTECFEIADCARIEKFAREMIIEGRRQMREEAADLAGSHGLLWGEGRNTRNPSTVPQEAIEEAIRALKTDAEKEA